MLDEGELARLLGAMAGGDRAAAQALYRMVGGRLYGIANRILRDSALAEDAAHQAFLKIWKNAHRFDAAKGKASTWITILTRHAAIDCRPRQMNELPDEIEAPRLDETFVHPRLRQALADLPEVHRNAVVLMYVYGLTHSELAAHLQAPLGTVKSWVRRGTAALKESLAG
ncbi:MAG: sigma-70 family RNA polymerase sigma factor [Phenylobacterium sp.]|uniref:sigma-70 family RNA polymerase sigma factor n=1 Tax=Phenylobacterium sp. TaxID=1871053 RepID=UPI001A4D74C9|nr:sigma-70 family RNA polymerase sigma factor [Phenylobacterium sp.]MBL8770423.1 sigma-70 family RNA polymerase sigma factor [Phenylobacterium sp.]